jgi:two-component system, LytTR family, response regulator LytT
MKILIVDDERPARGELRFMLGQIEASADVDEARNGEEALAHVARHRPDVVFLDIAMPGMSGLAVAAALLDDPDPPLIVFATAFDVHAVRAFELAALDYVVKPVAEQRLAQTMIRIRAALKGRDLRRQQQESVRSYLQKSLPADAPRLDKVWAERENETAVLVTYADILWVEADNKKTYLQTAQGERLSLRATLKELEERLAAHQIVRVHKTYLANLNHVAEIVPWFSGAYVLRMDDAAGTEIPLSRQFAKVIRDMSNA